MIEIGICDDNKVILENIKYEILLKSNKIGRDVKITTFSEGKKMLDILNKNNKIFDLIFLDIDMPNIDGFKIAEYIRRYNNKMIIIFITSMDNLVYDSFKYSPLRFIRKNSLNGELDEGLLAAFKQIDKINNYYVFKTYEGVLKIVIEDVIYIESIMRKIYINTSNNKYQLIGYKFNALVNTFQNNNFVMIHRTLVVNMKYIFSIESNEVILDSGKKLNLSRYRSREVRQAFAKFDGYV